MLCVVPIVAFSLISAEIMCTGTVPWGIASRFWAWSQMSCSRQTLVLFWYKLDLNHQENNSVGYVWLLDKILRHLHVVNVQHFNKLAYCHYPSSDMRRYSTSPPSACCFETWGAERWAAQRSGCRWRLHVSLPQKSSNTQSNNSEHFHRQSVTCTFTALWNNNVTLGDRVIFMARWNHIPDLPARWTDFKSAATAVIKTAH